MLGKDQLNQDQLDLRPIYTDITLRWTTCAIFSSIMGELPTIIPVHSPFESVDSRKQLMLDAHLCRQMSSAG